MDADISLTILKLIIALVGGVSGTVGLIYNHRSKHGTLTQAGVALLILISAAALAGAAVSIIEGQKNRNESKEQLARAEAFLNELNRISQPISQFEATFEIEISPVTTRSAEYIDRVRNSVNERLHELRKIEINLKHPGMFASSYNPHGEPLTVEIENDLDLWPKQSENEIYRLFNHHSFSVSLNKSPIPAEKFGTTLSNIDFAATTIFPTNASLQWDLKSQKLFLSLTFDYPKNLWRTSGRITSIVDLQGAQAIFVPNGASNFQLPERYASVIDPKQEAEYRALILASRVRHISINFGNGRKIRLHQSQLESTKVSYADLAYTVVFPTSSADFQKFIEAIDED